MPRASRWLLEKAERISGERHIGLTTILGIVMGAAR